MSLDLPIFVYLLLQVSCRLIRFADVGAFTVVSPYMWLAYILYKTVQMSFSCFQCLKQRCAFSMVISFFFFLLDDSVHLFFKMILSMSLLMWLNRLMGPVILSVSSYVVEIFV